MKKEIICFSLAVFTSGLTFALPETINGVTHFSHEENFVSYDEAMHKVFPNTENTKYVATKDPKVLPTYKKQDQIYLEMKEKENK